MTIENYSDDEEIRKYNSALSELDCVHHGLVTLWKYIDDEYDVNGFVRESTMFKDEFIRTLCKYSMKSIFIELSRMKKNINVDKKKLMGQNINDD